MELQKTMKQVWDYVKDQICKGNYQFVSCEKNTAKVNIDGFNLRLFFYLENKYMILYFIDETGLINKEDRLFAEEQFDIAWSHLKPQMDEYIKTTLIKEKEQELEALKGGFNG
jgi:hypothetical protein